MVLFSFIPSATLFLASMCGVVSSATIASGEALSSIAGGGVEMLFANAVTGGRGGGGVYVDRLGA